MSSITQAKAEAQKLIKRYNRLQAEAKVAPTQEAARKAAEAEKLVSQISALQSAIAKLQAKDRKEIASQKPATPPVSIKITTILITEGGHEDIKRVEAEKAALEERINHIEEAQKKTRAQIEQLTRARAELARLKTEAERSVAHVARERRTNDERLQQELARLIKKKEAEHHALKQELESVRQQAQKDAELLKVQRDAARAMMERQKQLEKEQSLASQNRGNNKNLLIGLGLLSVFTILLLIILIWNAVTQKEPPPKPTPKIETQPEKKQTSKEELPGIQALGMYRDTLKSGKGPLMVKLPRGSFKMGSKSSLPYTEERPQHEVILESFSISKFEITFEEFDWFATATGRRLPNDNGWGRGKQPVVNVSWDDALDYTKWLSMQTGYKYRLPSEREWEYAAKAGTETPFWWGYKVGKNHANCGICGSQWDGKQTSPVGSFQPNKFGIHDMIGNVMEWTLSCFHSNYIGAPRSGNLWDGGDCTWRVARSSSFRSYEDSLRATKRNKFKPSTQMDSLGFRVVRIE